MQTLTDHRRGWSNEHRRWDTYPLGSMRRRRVRGHHRTTATTELRACTAPRAPPHHRDLERQVLDSCDPDALAGIGAFGAMRSPQLSGNEDLAHRPARDANLADLPDESVDAHC